MAGAGPLGHGEVCGFHPAGVEPLQGDQVVAAGVPAGSPSGVATRLIRMALTVPKMPSSALARKAGDVPKPFIIRVSSGHNRGSPAVRDFGL